MIEFSVRRKTRVQKISRPITQISDVYQLPKHTLFEKGLQIILIKYDYNYMSLSTNLAIRPYN